MTALEIQMTERGARPSVATRLAQRLSIVGFVSVLLAKAIICQFLDVIAGRQKP